MSDLIREEDLDDEAYQIKEVFARFGLASYQGQVLERGLANVLTVAGPTNDSEHTPHIDAGGTTGKAHTKQ